jgi:uncharacterized alkaline shock family protein YloU
MASRHRKEQQGFALQPAPLSLDGQQPASGVAERGESRRAAEASPDAQLAGKIEVSTRAVAHLASRAAERSYGVVGLATRHARPGWAELLRREEVHKGVEVNFIDDHVVIELYVVIEYGTRISEVARNIMSNVKFAVESALDVKSVRVNVNVRDIRVSK